MGPVNCPVRNIRGDRCQLRADHPEAALDHEYPPPGDPRDATIARLIAERDQAQIDLAVLRTTLAMEAKHADEYEEAKSSAFWYALWTEGNRRNAELALELSRVRARTAGPPGAEPSGATSLRSVMALVYRYADARVQDELAAERDAGHATLRRNGLRCDETRAALETALVALGATS